MPQNIDYSYKSYILNNFNKLLIAERKATMFSYSQSLFNTYGLVNYSMKEYLTKHNRETYLELKEYCDLTNLSKELKECSRINHASFERVKRLKDRVMDILSTGCASFITLTFTNKVFKDTNELTRRKYVSRWLRSFGVPYVANIDYGKNTNREHYHAVIGCSIPFKSWSYGFSDIEPIKTKTENDIICLSKYVSKLTNHAIKETTKRCALLYSRD